MGATTATSLKFSEVGQSQPFVDPGLISRDLDENAYPIQAHT